MYVGLWAPPLNPDVRPHMPARESTPPRFFRTAAEFRAWLEKNGRSRNELLVGFYKVESRKPSMTWSESVDEALCFGWIDGVRTRIDMESYKIRFTPRRKGSIWSSVNISRARKLIAEGRMHPAGRDAYARRVERKSSVYSYEQEGSLSLSTAEEQRFRKNKPAWAFFQNVAPSYRRTITYWVVSAKQAATRERRLLQLIEACGNETRLLK